MCEGFTEGRYPLSLPDRSAGARIDGFMRCEAMSSTVVPGEFDRDEELLVEEARRLEVVV